MDEVLKKLIYFIQQYLILNEPVQFQLQLIVKRNYYFL